MAGNIPRNPTSLYLLTGGLAGDDHVLAQVEPRMFEGPQALYDALWPSYNAARENNILVLASMESKHLTYDLSVMELMDVCRAAYDSSDGEEDQEDENDPTCVCLEVKVGKKIHTMAKIDPTEFEGAEVLEAEVLSQCENLYRQYDPVFVTFLKKSKISKFVNDDASRASVRGICRSAYPVN